MASVVDERNMNGEQWWNDIDSRKPKNSQDDLQMPHWLVCDGTSCFAVSG